MARRLRSALPTTADDLLALYVGIGPNAVNGAPSPPTEHKFRAYQHTIEAFIRSKAPHLMRVLRPYEGLVAIRRRFAKTIRNVLVHTPYITLERIYWAARSMLDTNGRSVILNGIPDLYTGLRMLRTFETRPFGHMARPCEQETQRTLIYHAHTGHCMNVFIFLMKLLGPSNVHVMDIRGPPGMDRIVQHLMVNWQLSRSQVKDLHTRLKLVQGVYRPMDVPVLSGPEPRFFEGAF